MTAEKVESHRIAGVTRVVVGSGAIDLQERLDEQSAVAERFTLR